MDLSSTEHLDNAIKHIHQKYPNAPIYIVGFSMGAIQGLKWLGEHAGKDKPVKGMVSISCPVSLGLASPKLSQFKHLIYAKHMTHSLIKLAVFHKDLIEKLKIDIDYGRKLLKIEKVTKCSTPTEFDTVFSTKVLGYKSLDDLYANMTCKDSFKNIDVPLFLILAKNDPTFE
jgi:predicted alpha/beta-fold hydrolase